MPKVTLPDGTLKSFDKAITVADVASSIGSVSPELHWPVRLMAS